MNQAHQPDSFADRPRFQSLITPLLALSTLAVAALVLPACHAPESGHQPGLFGLGSSGASTSEENVGNPPAEMEVEPTEPVEPSQPVEPAEPLQPSEPVGTGQQAEPAKPDSPFPPPEQDEDGFDLFEDEFENQGSGGEPFDQETLDKRVAWILPKVEEIRGMKFKHSVPAGLQSADEFIEFAMAEFEHEYGFEQFAAMGEAYRLLGLIEPDMDLLQTTMDLLKSQVGGYYDPRTKSFYMIDSFNQGAMADIILAHELTHALDDQVYDLQEMMSVAKDNSDYEFAVRTVAEGSGTSLMNLFALQGLLGGWLELDADAMAGMMGQQAESIREAPEFLIISLSLPYLEGNKLLTREKDMILATMAVPKNEDIDYAFANPPRSSEQVLHMEKYWDEDQRDEPTLLELEDHSKLLGDGWVLEDQNVLGELGCFIVTEPNIPDLSTAQGQIGGKWTNDAASGWDGDRYQSYVGPDGARILVWTTLWDSVEDANEFHTAMEGKPTMGNQFLVSIQSAGPVVVSTFANAKGQKSVAKVLVDPPKLERNP
jgi:hypothetical protein